MTLINRKHDSNQLHLRNINFTDLHYNCLNISNGVTNPINSPSFTTGRQ